MGLLDILKQYTGDATAPSGDVHAHFDEVASQASPSDLGNGIAAAFRSDATPPFGDLVGSLFGHADGSQRAGMLNELVRGLGAGGLASVAGGLLGRVLGTGANAGAGAPTITADQASKLSPDDVAKMAAHAEQQDPSIVDRLASFYAEHPTLVKTLGTAALGIALRNMSRRG